jgi:hypothetical protein
MAAKSFGEGVPISIPFDTPVPAGAVVRVQVKRGPFEDPFREGDILVEHPASAVDVVPEGLSRGRYWLSLELRVNDAHAGNAHVILDVVPVVHEA